MVDARVPEGESRMVVGIRLPKSARVYYFDPGDLSLEHGTRVWVTTEHGQVWGEVVIPPRLVPVADLPQPLQPVVRLWNQEDAEELDRIKVREQEARAFCQERIEARGLPMRLVDVEWTFDGGKITFYFVADNRVDFRELVHDLAARYHCRVELRQIGVRDHARLLGGYGPCGRPLCCATFLRDFAPVAIRMAKEQNLSLNPGRISGMCGRLMCCLRYEDDSEGSQVAKHEGDGLGAEEGSEEVAEVAVAAETAEKNGCCCCAGAGRAGGLYGRPQVTNPAEAGSAGAEAETDAEPEVEAGARGPATALPPPVSEPAAGEEERERVEARFVSATAKAVNGGDSGGEGSAVQTGHKRGGPGGERHHRSRGRRDAGSRKGSPATADTAATTPGLAAEAAFQPQPKERGLRPGAGRDRHRRQRKRRNPNPPAGPAQAAEAGWAG